MSVYEKLERALACVRRETAFVPRVALVLGSGLGDFAEQIQVEASVDYAQIEGMPVSTVPGHRGRYIFGRLAGVPIVCMQGRVHYYEGYTMEQVVMPVRLMRRMGAEILFLTNASGGIDPTFHPGTLMLIEGHISSFVPNPLIGENDERLGPRFPDMTAVYDGQLRAIIEQAAQEAGIALAHGVYLQATGPSFESPEEIRMFRLLGASAVGMSSVCEAIAARHMGMRICGVSCVSNLAAGITGQPLTHEEVITAADEAAPRFTALLKGAIARM